MSQPLISRSPDLKRLEEEGYPIKVIDGHLVILRVPYANSSGKVAYGSLVSTLALAGERTARPDDHIALFCGETPCDENGQPLSKVINSTETRELSPNLEVNFLFSSKPADGYPDYYAKMMTYMQILATPANAIDPAATARVGTSPGDPTQDSVFVYSETASGRAGIGDISAKLQLSGVAIVGAGGTGSYVLDLVAKTPVRQINIFDDDEFLNHNAFRAPGAARLDELERAPTKVQYLAERYSEMHRGIVPHAAQIDESNVEALREMDFVFLCIDGGPAKKLIADTLIGWEIPFIDVGIGVWRNGLELGGLVRTSTSTPRRPVDTEQFGGSTADDVNEYSRNIQVAELNSLNAALAVIKWKKIFGFYADVEAEHGSHYSVISNHITNFDQS
ncbi:MAG: ThiF family adenylyltransferase [Solirubrobacterales bacterium]|nr:ThiF family adenylyltransferase [Solirubrobacterales bacterium]